ncbi:unnamed protein product, partial [marine sediment metagenome]
MKKRVIITCLILFFLPIVLASSIDDEMQKITHYAEEYEIGNIDYVKLLLYTATVRKNLNKNLGIVEREGGGILKQEQIREVLGEPSDETKWVWVENEQQDKRIDDYVPVWKKIVFDGKKIRIMLGAWPTLLEKEGEDLLGYRLNFMIDFKRPKEQLNIQGKINEVQSLAEIFNSDSSMANAENLAK